MSEPVEREASGAGTPQVPAAVPAAGRRHLPTGPTTRPGGRLAALAVLAVLGLVLAACGSSGSSSTSSSATAGKTSTPSSSPATGSSAPTPHATSVPGASALPTKAQLSSLTNYTFTFTDNGALAVKGSVYSPTDFQTTQPSVTLHTGHATYTKLGTTWYETTQPANQDSYASSPYPSSVQGFLDFLKVAGAVVTKGASCTEAGQAGTTFTIESKELNSKLLSELSSACIANHGGALLSYSVGAQGSGVGTPGHSATYSFTVTSIGTVAEIPVPTNVKKDLTSTGTSSPTG